MLPRNLCALRKSSTASRILSQIEDDSVKNIILPPRDARVVICGGGVMGASVAYHLAKLGWGSETVLIEQNRYAIPARKTSLKMLFLQSWRWYNLAFFRVDWCV